MSCREGVKECVVENGPFLGPPSCLLFPPLYPLPLRRLYPWTTQQEQWARTESTSILCPHSTTPQYLLPLSSSLIICVLGRQHLSGKKHLPAEETREYRQTLAFFLEHTTLAGNQVFAVGGVEILGPSQNLEPQALFNSKGSLPTDQLSWLGPHH